MGYLRSRTVYVVGVSDNPVKIGLAAQMKTRLIALQIGCPDPLVVHYKVRVPDYLGQPIESAVHKRLAAHHRRGEWFNVTAEQAAEAVKEIAAIYMDRAASITRLGGDVIDQIGAKYPLQSGVRTAVRHYMDRLSTPLGRKSIARWDAVLAKRCGPASYTLFKKIIAQGDSLFELFTSLGLNSAARDRAEASLAKTLNTLSEYMDWERQEALVRAIESRRPKAA